MKLGAIDFLVKPWDEGKTAGQRKDDPGPETFQGKGVLPAKGARSALQGS
jgi:hypothetical protein